MLENPPKLLLRVVAAARLVIPSMVSRGGGQLIVGCRHGSDGTVPDRGMVTHQTMGRSVSLVATSDGERVALTAFVDVHRACRRQCRVHPVQQPGACAFVGRQHAICACRCGVLGRHGAAEAGVPARQGTGRLAAVWPVQLRRLVRVDLFGLVQVPRRTRPDLAGAGAASHALARGAVATGAPRRRGGHGNAFRSRGRRGDFSCSIAAGRALTVGARLGWRRDLLCASPGARTTLPPRAPREHERRRHDGGSGCAVRSVTRCE